MAQDQLPLAPLKRCVFELLKKILSVATADLPLAAHLLLRLAPLDMKMVCCEWMWMLKEVLPFLEQKFRIKQKIH